MSKLVPNDPRVTYESTKLSDGTTYGYILGEPQGTPKGTVFLIHGFPDISFGWRCQIPYLMSRGYRVVTPDMLGYGGTDAPAEIEPYRQKTLAGHMNELARKYVGPKGQIILGGHDWGGVLVWRTLLWYPELISAIFSVCTPYGPPSPKYAPLEVLVDSGIFKTLRYQLQLIGPDVEGKIQGREKVRQFLNAIMGGRTPEKELAFNIEQGVLFDRLPRVEMTRLASPEELDHITDRYMLHKAPELHGPLNWYRVRKLNFDDELPLAQKEGDIIHDLPALMITASDDAALPPAMAKNMDKYFTNLTRAEVAASHWALIQTPDEVNGKIGEWLDQVESGAMKPSL